MPDFVIVLLFLAGVFGPVALAANAVGGLFPVSDEAGPGTTATMP